MTEGDRLNKVLDEIIEKSQISSHVELATKMRVSAVLCTEILSFFCLICSRQPSLLNELNIRVVNNLFLLQKSQEERN